MKALVSTISPISGGVPRMAQFVADTLSAGGIEPVFAYYQPYSISPELSVPAYCLLRRKAGSRLENGKAWRHHAIGAWLPELEFTHYLPTRNWKALIAECDFHLSVSGNCLAATAFALQGIPYWAWVATSWHEDREQRLARFSLPRRLLDRLVNRHGIRWLERRILHNGEIVALSDYTRKQLNGLAGNSHSIDVMPMAIDTGLFKQPDGDRPRRKRIGFVGRLSDPRKNAALLVRTLDWCRQQGAAKLDLVLIGGDDPELRRTIRDHQLQDRVTVLEDVDNRSLPGHLGNMDVFVIPSYQEGLCIAGLEAMSCGVPVVSTPCGGPAQFVIEDETGYIADARPAALGAAILNIINNPGLRARLAANARELIEREYSIEAIQSRFWASFDRAFARGAATRAVEAATGVGMTRQTAGSTTKA